MAISTNTSRGLSEQRLKGDTEHDSFENTWLVLSNTNSYKMYYSVSTTELSLQTIGLHLLIFSQYFFHHQMLVQTLFVTCLQELLFLTPQRALCSQFLDKQQKMMN